MNKRFLFISLIITVSATAGCVNESAQPPVTLASPVTSYTHDTVPESALSPLPEYTAYKFPDSFGDYGGLTVPDFLSSVQKDNFVKAVHVWNALHMCLSDFFADIDLENAKTYYKADKDRPETMYTYIRTGVNYESFYDALCGVFTQEWVENELDGLLIEDNKGELCFVDGARGGNILFDRIDFEKTDDTHFTGVVTYTEDSSEPNKTIEYELTDDGKLFSQFSAWL